MNTLNLKCETARNAETFQNLDRGSKSNLFTEKDHAIVRAALANLKGPEHQIVLMRFWEQNTLSEIAEILDLSVQEVEKHLASAFQTLKRVCLKNPEFSRAIRLLAANG